jgi:hypothetical protein
MARFIRPMIRLVRSALSAARLSRTLTSTGVSIRRIDV